MLNCIQMIYAAPPPSPHVVSPRWLYWLGLAIDGRRSLHLRCVKQIIRTPPIWPLVRPANHRRPTKSYAASVSATMSWVDSARQRQRLDSDTEAGVHYACIRQGWLNDLRVVARCRCVHCLAESSRVFDVALYAVTAGTSLRLLK